MHTIKILVPANLVFSAGIREIAKEAANLAEFSAKQVNMYKLVVDEIFMNAIRYGSNKESQVFYEVMIDGNTLFSAIEDEGKGENTAKAEDIKTIIAREMANTSLHKGHGRGLAQIMSTLVKAFEVSDKEGGGLRFEFVVEKTEEKESDSSPVATPIPQEEKILPEVCVTLSGSIDMTNAESVIEQVSEVIHTHNNIPFRLVLDMENLQYGNSYFIGYLARWHETLQSAGGESCIQNISKEMFEILDLVGLTQIFPIRSTDTAKESL